MKEQGTKQKKKKFWCFRKRGFDAFKNIKYFLKLEIIPHNRSSSNCFYVNTKYTLVLWVWHEKKKKIKIDLEWLYEVISHQNPMYKCNFEFCILSHFINGHCFMVQNFPAVAKQLPICHLTHVSHVTCHIAPVTNGNSHSHRPPAANSHTM